MKSAFLTYLLYKNLHPINAPSQSMPAYLYTHIRHNLENLLNTRKPDLQWPEEYLLLNQSLLAYGISDITGKIVDPLSLQQKLCTEIKQAIENFETRLKTVQVTVLPNHSIAHQLLYLRIDAVLIPEFQSERLVFDSIFSSIFNQFTILEPILIDSLLFKHD